MYEESIVLILSSFIQIDMMKKHRHLYILLVILLFSYSTINAENYISGYVQTNLGDPVEGCVVSDGFSVVNTDNNGAYKFLKNDSSEFVFISLPSAYEMPVDQNGLPLLYGQVPATPSDFSHNFVLTPYADGGAADINHIMIGITDPQVQNSYETWRFRNESIKDIKEHIATFPAGTPVYGVVVGDLVWDEYARFPEHTESISQLGFPVFNVIGNHDHDRMIRQDWGSDHYFKENYGPTYYSFNRGKIHYIVLDDIEYTNATGDKSYKHNIVGYQLEWLKKDIATIPKDMYIVFLTHAPFEGSNVANRQTVYNLVSSRRNTHAITGHHHRLTNYEIKNNFYDHTLGAVQGAFWSGDMCTDGTPNGYGVFQASSTGFKSWYYKSTGFDKDYQLRVYPLNSFIKGESMTENITANIWNYDSKWSEVHIYENGEKNIMYQYTGLDPLTYDFLNDNGDTRPNYPGSDGGTLASRNPGATAHPHMFNYKPKDPNAEFIIEVTDRNNVKYRVPVLRNLMVASFEKDDASGEYLYKQDFNSFREYPNQYLSAEKIGKCTYVQGHSPVGWYACTSANVLPGSGMDVQWQQFNYLWIDNGNSSKGGLMSYGEGNPNSATNNDSNRSLGSLISPTNRNIHFGVLIENNTGETIIGLDVSYIGKMWRGGTQPNKQQILKFSFAVNPDVISLRKRTLSIAEIETAEIENLSFVSPENTDASSNSACNGNSAANQKSISGTIPVKLYPGDIVLLRWEDSDDPGNDNGLAIDDLIIKVLDTSNGIGQEEIINRSFYNIGTVIYFDEAPMSLVWLYDITGRLLKEVKLNDTVLDLTSEVTHGVHFMKTKFGTKKMLF